jgi:hypothetical protein
VCQKGHSVPKSDGEFHGGRAADLSVSTQCAKKDSDVGMNKFDFS